MARAKDRFRGGATYHAKRVPKLEAAFNEALADMKMAATCRRSFSAMQRATRIVGAMNDDAYSYNSPSEPREAVQDAQNRLAVAYEVFMEKCLRRPS